MVTINTSNPPEAKQMVSSAVAGTEEVILVTVPNYNTTSPRTGQAVIVGGVAEIVSPLVLSNVTTNTVMVSATITRGGTPFSVGKNVLIPGHDVVVIPLQGQFLMTDETLSVVASADEAVHATVSYTLGATEEDDI